jgi:catecholate siderophore receptor
LLTNLAAPYVQDQVTVSRYLELLAGVRFDYFGLRFHNNRNGDSLRRIDRLVSPRAGIVIKPLNPPSLYASYGVSYLPSSGDQFSSLTNITQQVKPERFTNYEVGAKWDIRRNLTLTGALYLQERTSTRATDPADPTRIVQTGSQRTNGLELGVNGNFTRKWQVVGGYAYQNAFINSATNAAPKGALVAMVPRHTFSLWNNYQVIRRLGFGLGLVNRDDMFAAIDNTVVLPGYMRADAAVYFKFNERFRLQSNLTNLFNKKY